MSVPRDSQEALSKGERLVEPTSATVDLLPYKMESHWRTGVVVPPWCSCSRLITVLVTLVCPSNTKGAKGRLGPAFPWLSPVLEIHHVPIVC